MKLNKLISILLAAVMLIASVPALAEELPAIEGIPVKIPEGYHVDTDLYQGEFLGEKSNLAQIVLYDAEGESQWAFVDRKGNVTLFKEFFPDFYSNYAGMDHYYNGLAAVISYSNEERNFKIGYIDEEGNEVIPQIYDAIENPMAANMTLYGNFYGDYTYVFQDIEKPSYREVTGRYAKIDREGNIIGEWSDIQTLFSYDSWGKGWLGYKEYPLAHELMLTTKTNYIPIKQTGPWSTEYRNVSIIDTSLHYDNGTDAVVLNTTDGVIIADIDQFVTKNKAELKIVDWRSLDDAHCIKVSLRNKGTKTDVSDYAIVFFDDHSMCEDYHKCEHNGTYNCKIGEVHFLDSVTLSAGANKEIEFATQFDGKSVLRNGIKSIIVKFDSEADKAAFKASVPYFTLYRDYEIERFEGEKWFKDTFGLTIDERWRTY